MLIYYLAILDARPILETPFCIDVSSLLLPLVPLPRDVFVVGDLG
jgi:hypothetical protein